jgi:hypothetical protein
MEVLCQCTVKEFSFWRAVSRRVDALMQQCLIDSQAPRTRSFGYCRARLRPPARRRLLQIGGQAFKRAIVNVRGHTQPMAIKENGSGTGTYQIVNERRPTMIHFRGCRSGALGEIRTPDPRIRSPMLYPAELRAQFRMPRISELFGQFYGTQAGTFREHFPMPYPVAGL